MDPKSKIVCSALRHPFFEKGFEKYDPDFCEPLVDSCHKTMISYMIVWIRRLSYSLRTLPPAYTTIHQHVATARWHEVQPQWHACWSSLITWQEVPMLDRHEKILSSASDECLFQSILGQTEDLLTHSIAKSLTSNAREHLWATWQYIPSIVV